MTARRASTSPKQVSPVVYDTETAAPLRLKYPNGQLMIAIHAHRALIQQAAAESHTGIFIVNNETRLVVYHTADGCISSVPADDPIGFFDAFQRIQIEAMQARHANVPII